MSKRFTVDARTVLQLGRQSIKDNTTAVLELVKNSYDADASIVEVEINNSAHGGCIRIADNGIGMLDREIDEHWLRIGYSEKRNRKFSARGRRKTGEKGVGRISADRLGVYLFLRTLAEGQPTVGIAVDWDRFAAEGKEIRDIPVRELKNPTIAIPSGDPTRDGTGTELIIRRLRQNWTESDVEQLHEELSILTPPFRAAQDFEIRLSTNVAPRLNGRVESPFYGAAEIELSAVLYVDRVRYYIKDRIGGGDLRLTESGRIRWPQLVQRSGAGEQVAPREPRTGPVKLKLLFYLRQQASLEGTGFGIGDLREFLNRNAGVKIYRDEVRVKPYGDPGRAEGDWLGLSERKTRDPAGVGRPTFRASANQVVGAVFLSRDRNPNLVDSAAREGLIHGDAYGDLRALVIGCLSILEAHRHEAYKNRKVVQTVVRPTEDIKSLAQELSALRADLHLVRKSVPRSGSTSRSVDRALSHVSSVSTRIQAATESLNEMLSQAGVLRGLSTLGIAASVFGHETQSSIAAFLASTALVRELLGERPISADVALREVKKAAENAERVAAWGAFALARVKRDKRRRRKVWVDQTMQGLTKALEPAYAASMTELSVDLEPVQAQTFEMDVETVVVNLLTNAYVACQQRRKRIVRLVLRPESRNGSDGFAIAVSDSGPGVPQNLRDKIWRPLFTTRMNEKGDEVGTGLGLTIVDSIVEELDGQRAVDQDPELRGARFTVWLPSK